VDKTEYKITLASDTSPSLSLYVTDSSDDGFIDADLVHGDNSYSLFIFIATKSCGDVRLFCTIGCAISPLAALLEAKVLEEVALDWRNNYLHTDRVLVCARCKLEYYDVLAKEDGCPMCGHEESPLVSKDNV
jgi:hypothetical protein